MVPTVTSTLILFLVLVNRGDPGFQVRGGALKKIAPSGGRREKCWGISCENHDFTPKILFFPILGGGEKKILMNKSLKMSSIALILRLNDRSTYLCLN
jgi:hypothetical protein